MSIKAVCTGCGKAFNAPDQYAGKKVKCKVCGAAFRVPGPAAATTADAPRAASAKPAAARTASAPPAARKPAKAVAPVATADDDGGEYGLSDGGADDWSALEAAAPAPSYNPGAVAAAPAYNPPASSGRGTVFPATAQPMSARRNVVAPGQGMHPLMMVQIGAVALPLLLLVLGMIVPVMATPAILLSTFIGIAFMFWGQIGILMTAAAEGGVCVLLYLFMPFYPIYFILTRMEEVSHHLLRTIAGIGLIIGGVMLILSQSPS